ncbi:gag-asp_proteas domain-containing protein [Gossypium australe]|uniref:Gag-asp_proteas domain-containing protein n=1 Tax=Gossypium australe TaxID=47621 RepID=A0A5B6UX02_9ROSI|nr:gag-asp_proteas domain-containing protein [Gossypium australe]
MFLSRLEEKKKRDEDEFLSFLNLFKTLNVKLALIELIEKVPKYAKFLKEIMSRCRKIKVGEQVNKALIVLHVPQKLKDLRSFTIPIEIGIIHFNRALHDLGANINLMSLSICEKLGLRDLKNTQITLQLADRSSVHPKGILEDVLVKVHSFIIPTNFVVLNFEED